MTESTHESTAAWRELLETIGGLDASFLEGDRAVTDDRHIGDGYRMLATTLGVAFDTYLFPDPSRPRWVEVNSPARQDRRWGGDNTDAYYFMCPVDPKRRYRISGNKGDSVYFSVTAYNEPSPGAWSDRIVAILRDDDLDIDADGNFSFELGPTPDAAVLMTRDYQADPQTGRPSGGRSRRSTSRTRSATATPKPRLPCGSAAWMRTMFAILPLAVGAGWKTPIPSDTRYRRPQTNSPTRTRCRTRTSAGRHAMPATPTAASCSRTMRRSSPTGHHRVGSGIWWCGTSSWRPRCHRRAQLGERPQRGAERRRFRDGRAVARDDCTPQFADDAGLSARQPRVPVVPRRQGARAPRWRWSRWPTRRQASSDGVSCVERDQSRRTPVRRTPTTPASSARIAEDGDEVLPTRRCAPAEPPAIPAAPYQSHRAPRRREHQQQRHQQRDRQQALIQQPGAGVA